MPLMNSESLEDHQACGRELADMKQIADNGGDKAVAHYVVTTQEFIKKHTAIVRQFGRYLYRNECLGRESTKEEKGWLKNGGETLGA